MRVPGKFPKRMAVKSLTNQVENENYLKIHLLRLILSQNII